MNLTLRQLTYFVAVAEAGQVSAAARELHVSQSAVTTAVQDVEKTLRMPVFTRTSRGMVLTGTGEQFLPKAREILRMVEEAALTASVPQSPGGPVRIGATYTVMGYFLPHHMQHLGALYPDLDPSWEEMERQTLEQRVLQGDLDLGVMLTSNLSEQLAHETFVHSRRRLWMAPNHPLATRDSITLADVEPYPYALLAVDESDKTTRSYWGDLSPRLFLTTTSVEAVRSIVANGNAVTILSDAVYRPWSLEGKRIHTRDVTPGIPDLNIGLVWDGRREMTPAMRATYKYFHNIFHTPALAVPRG